MNTAHKYDIMSSHHNDYDVSVYKDFNAIKDDPFNLGCTVKGLTNMNHKKNLADYAGELVAHYAKYESEHYELFLLDLPDDEQGELARLFIEATGRETSECIYGNDFSIENAFTCALLSMLQDDSKENREKFAEVTRKNTINYYEKSLQLVLDEACNNYLHSMNNEAGSYAIQDQDSGEIFWGKF